MQIGRIDSDLAWTDFVVVRLLRRWAAARGSGFSALPSLVQLAAELRESAEAAVALHSVFQLTEDCLGRDLRAECCCSRSLTADERAVLALIATAPAQVRASAREDVPHGLPGALCWAAASARIALRLPNRPGRGAPLARCPFERQAPLILRAG